jgi:unsaturated rhamnogalacturonyl hydrolase
MRAANMGFVNPECYAVALKALPAILDCITPEGEVSQVSYGTPMGRSTKDFYKNIELKRMPYGQALALLFLLECVKES